MSTTVVYTRGPNGKFIASSIKKQKRKDSITAPLDSSRLGQFVDEAANQLHMLPYRIIAEVDKVVAPAGTAAALNPPPNNQTSTQPKVRNNSIVSLSDVSSLNSEQTIKSDPSILLTTTETIAESECGAEEVVPTVDENLPTSLFPAFPSFKMPAAMENVVKFHAPSFIGGILLTILLHRMSPFLAVQALVVLNLLKILSIWGVVIGAISWYMGLIKKKDIDGLKVFGLSIQQRVAPGVKIPWLVVSETPVVAAEAAPVASAPASVPTTAPVSASDSDSDTHVVIKPPTGSSAIPDSGSIFVDDTASIPLRSNSPEKRPRNNSKIFPYQHKEPSPKTVHSTRPVARRKFQSYDTNTSRNQHRPSIVSHQSYQISNYRPVELVQESDDLPLINPVTLIDNPAIVSPVSKNLPEIPPNFASDFGNNGLSRLNTAQSKRSVLGTRANYNKFMSNVKDSD